MVEIIKPEAVFQHTIRLEMYERLVKVKKEHHVIKDNSEELTRLFFAIRDIIVSALTTAWDQIGHKHFLEGNTSIDAIFELSKFEEELLAAAKKYVPVWCEIKLFLDERGLSLGQQTRRGQIH